MNKLTRIITVVLLITGWAKAEWVKLDTVTLRNNPANDGDSFHVSHQGREYYFRLYFVDAPETNTKLKERIADQAISFKLDERTVLQKGKEAEQFTKKLLSKPFTVWTEWQDAKGDSQMKRYFAFVRNAQGQDLGQLLVGSGLARVYGAQADHPEGFSREDQWAELDRRLNEAKNKNLGVWAKESK